MGSLWTVGYCDVKGEKLMAQGIPGDIQELIDNALQSGSSMTVADIQKAINAKLLAESKPIAPYVPVDPYSTSVSVMPTWLKVGLGIGGALLLVKFVKGEF